MKASVLVEKCLDVANNYRTLYVMGCFGAPMTGGNVERYKKHHPFNATSDRIAMINAVANKNPPVFGFDCVNLIKGIMWGWNGDASQSYGGAKYLSNGVPETNADGMIRLCKNVSTDFSKIRIGSAVWLSGHIGVYIGNGLVVECTPAFKNNVQITVCTNVRGAKSGENGRKWVKHGEMPFIEYDADSTAIPTPSTSVDESTQKEGVLQVGDVVTFSGTSHYISSNSSDPKSCNGGTAKITQLNFGSKHPIHIIGDKSPCNAYGWVDFDTCKKNS